MGGPRDGLGQGPFESFVCILRAAGLAFGDMSFGASVANPDFLALPEISAHLSASRQTSAKTLTSVPE